MKNTKDQVTNVWLVSYYFGFGYHDHEKLFLTEWEARAFYDSLDVATRKDIYQVRDIWGWSEKQRLAEER